MERSYKNARELIITVASDIFARFGFRKTTMGEIASALHKGKSSIYHYFESKEEIFRSVVEKESQLLKTEVMGAISKEITPQEKLRVYFLTRMRILNRLANYYSVLTDEYFEHYSFVEKIRKKHDIDEINIIKEILQEGVKRGIFAVKDVELTAIAIFNALKGLEYSWATEKDISKTTRNIDTLMEVLFNGLNKR